MKATLHYENGESRSVDIPDEQPTPLAYVCKKTNSVHVLNTTNGYDFYQIPYLYDEGDTFRHDKGGRN